MPNGRAQRVCGKRSLKRIRCNLFREVVAAPVLFNPKQSQGDTWQPNDAGRARGKASPGPAGSAFILS
jgi:hypothetical protein